MKINVYSIIVTTDIFRNFIANYSPHPSLESQLHPPKHESHENGCLPEDFKYRYFFPLSLSTISKGNANFYHVEVAQFPRVIMRSLTRRVKRTRDTGYTTIPAAGFRLEASRLKKSTHRVTKLRTLIKNLG